MGDCLRLIFATGRVLGCYLALMTFCYIACVLFVIKFLQVKYIKKIACRINLV